MKDEPFNSFLYPEPGLLTLASVYILTHKHRKHPLFGGGGGRRGVPSPHMISDSGPEVETCVAKKFGACARSNALPVPAEGWGYANMYVGDEWLFASALVSNSWTDFI